MCHCRPRLSDQLQGTLAQVANPVVEQRFSACCCVMFPLSVVKWKRLCSQNNFANVVQQLSKTLIANGSEDIGCGLLDCDAV